MNKYKFYSFMNINFINELFKYNESNIPSGWILKCFKYVVDAITNWATSAILMTLKFVVKVNILLLHSGTFALKS